MLRLFEATVESGEVRGDRAARWLVHVVRGRLQGAQRLADTKLTADKFVTLLRFIQDGRLTEKSAVFVLSDLLQSEESVEEVLRGKGVPLGPVGGDGGPGAAAGREGALIVDTAQAIVTAHPHLVNAYRAGKANTMNALMGLAMKRMRGAADPAKLRAVIIDTIIQQPTIRPTDRPTRMDKRPTDQPTNQRTR
eukprot:GHVU01126370.1.p1 GENE.GHVU01126370.1~~GHVU01126370.1.p1  ORF type:complete len:193 (+),score=27.82 GHVU01126370.1:724-1302(+)